MLPWVVLEPALPDYDLWGLHLCAYELKSRQKAHRQPRLPLPLLMPRRLPAESRPFWVLPPPKLVAYRTALSPSAVCALEALRSTQAGRKNILDLAKVWLGPRAGVSAQFIEPTLSDNMSLATQVTSTKTSTADIVGPPR
jgi:hypothetical protein